MSIAHHASVIAASVARITLQVGYSAFTIAAASQVSVNRAGTVVGGATSISDHDWITPKNATVGDGYQVRVDTVSGVPTSGPVVGDWHALSTDRTWSATTAEGTWEFDISIRQGTGPTLRTERWSLTHSAL